MENSKITSMISTAIWTCTGWMVAICFSLVSIYLSFLVITIFYKKIRGLGGEEPESGVTIGELKEKIRQMEEKIKRSPSNSSDV